MSLEDIIQQRLKQAMKQRDEVTKSILRVALGEIQSIRARQGKITEEQAQKAVRKIIAGNAETIAASPDRDNSRLQQEMEILDALLPKLWDAEQITAFLAEHGVLPQIKAAGNDGQATGIAMKALKAEAAPVSGKDVAQLVRDVRQA